VGRRSLESGAAEAVARRGRADLDPVPLDRAVEAVRARPVARQPLTFRRLTGLDRSAPPPPETMRDAPWNPWTIPNAISFVRLALIPVFLVLAFSSDEGTDALPAILFAASPGATTSTGSRRGSPASTPSSARSSTRSSTAR
jgi:hypothetical protein